ncbi:MAG: Hsp20/alpha crystallin family protein [Caulobacteraceae bacterium]
MNRELTPWTGASGQGLLGRDPFTSLQRQVDRLFDDFLRPGEPRSFAAATNGVFPSLDVRETEQAYQIAAELPGLDRKDVEVKLRDNTLIISGEKRTDHTVEKGARTYAERTYGHFERAIPFDSEVDAGKVEANFKNGVLEVTLPKNPAARDKTRRIEIKG